MKRILLALLFICGTANAETVNYSPTSGGGGGGLSAISAYSLLSNNTSGSAVPSGNQALILGAPAFTGTGVVGQITGSINSYLQFINQNTSTGTSASADFIVANNNATDTTFYGDFGINGGNYTGSGSLNLPNATYLYGNSGDLVLGTTSNNGIHFIVNSGTTDAMAISAAGAVSINGAVNTSSLALVGNTDTASTNVLNITETWNNAATTFDAPIKLNVTNTASNSASLLADFQVGGVSQFSVNEWGDVTSNQVCVSDVCLQAAFGHGLINGVGFRLGETGGGTNNYITTTMDLGSTAAAKSQVDVYGNMSIGTGYATVTAAPTNGLIVQGNVGIGTASPASKLDVAGAIDINALNAISFPTSDTTAGASIAIGASALSGQTSSAAYGNTAVGYQALNGTMTTGGVQNTAIGYQALKSVTSGTQNLAIGWQAGAGITSTFNNTIIGASAGSGTFGNNNTLLGQGTFAYSGGSPSNNVAIGAGVGYAASWSNGVYIGNGAGKNGSSGNNNTIIGYQVSSTTLATGSNNILIGTSSSVDTVASSTSNEINIGGLLFFNNNSISAPAISACGTSPSIDTHANNKSGTVTVGTTATTCTITFAGTGYSTWNHCRVTSQGVNAAFAYSYTKTVLTVTGTALSGNIDYDCDGV